MRPRGFLSDWRPQRKSLDLLGSVETIIAEYAGPVRQIFYRLVARYSFEKSEKAYKSLVELLGMARRARRTPMDAIRDDTSISLHATFWDDEDNFVAAVRSSVDRFRLDPQRGQNRRLVVMC